MAVKTRVTLTLCLLVLGGVTTVWAQTNTTAFFEKQTFGLELDVSSLRYDEPNVKTKGMMYGPTGSYTYHDNVMLKAELRAAYGGVEWDGTTLAGTRVTQSDTHNILAELRGLGGYDFPVLSSSVLTPYLGIGLRYVNNDAVPQPYERETYYLYSPIGVTFVTHFGKGWSLGESVEYDYLWGGYQTSHPMDNLPGLRDDADLPVHQKNGYGARGSVALEKRYRNIVFAGGPFVNYWKVERLNPQTYPYAGNPAGFVWREPGNNSLEIGMELRVRF
jgi:hypothetical protein